MKTFSQFQEEIKNVPSVRELGGLGGGGGGTNAITDKAKGKSLKNRIKDVGKILTFPFHKKRVDPTEKFATEGVMAIPAAAGVVSKVLPAAVATYGAVKTIKDTLPTFMQIKNPKRSVYTGTRKSQYVKKERKPIKANEKTNEVAKELGLDLTDPRQRRKAQSRAVARGLKKQNKTNKKINPETGDVIKPRYNTKLKGIQIQPKKGEAEATEKLINKLNNPSYLEKVRRNVRKEEVAIANNASSGNIAGLPPDDPPVKKKKRYIYGGTGSRKMWMNNK